MEELRFCKVCQQQKVTGAFYSWRRNENTQYDSCCKTCKKARSKGSPKATAQPKRIIEPQIEIPDRIIEPKSTSLSVNGSDKIAQLASPRANTETIDFGLWKQMYGRDLTEVECIEIKTNLAAFFGVLLAEDKKQSRTTV